MRTLLFLGLILMISIPVSAQNQKLTGKEKRELKKKEAAAQLQKYREDAERKSWVIETNTVYDRQSTAYPVNPSINFVAVVGETLVVQLSFDQIMGWNGVGGITMEGNVTKYEIKGKEGKPFTINIRGAGAVLGSVDLTVSVSSAGLASCTIRTATTGQRITFAGQYVAAEDSGVYKGSSFK